MKTAHINDLGEKQSLKEHLSWTAERAEQFAESFGCGGAGYLCGLMHDIGKYSGDFQRRIQDPEHVKKGAQTLPVSYLDLCVAAISELAAHYRSTVVLCTEIQPALGQMFRKYLKNMELQEICDGVEDIYRWFRRTGIRYAGVLDMDSLCGELQENRHREGRRPVEESVVSVFRLEGSNSGFLSQNISAFR
jgi:hypothetical protein